MSEKNSNFLLEHFKNMENISYKGICDNRVSRFEGTQNNQQHVILVNTFVHPDEAEIWTSCSEMFSLLLAQMEPKFKGVFRFELLYLDLRKGLDQFQQGLFLKQFLEVASKLRVGECGYLNYSSSIGVISKLADEEWGKCTFVSHVKKYDKHPTQLHLTLKQMVLMGEKDAQPLDLVIWDVSRKPIYDVNNTIQSGHLNTLKANLNMNSYVKSIVVIDGSGVHDLYCQTQLDLGF